MTKRTVTIKNRDGIHCRPAALLLETAKGYTGRITIASGADACELRSVLDLLAMHLAFGVQVTIEVDGPGETEIADQLAQLFEMQFDFVR